jgi:hypothetical protein
MAAVVRLLDKTAALEVMTALLEESSDVTPEQALVCVGDQINVDDDQGYLR